MAGGGADGTAGTGSPASPGSAGVGIYVPEGGAIDPDGGSAVGNLTITPADVGTTKIGHFGFFRPEHRDTLWRGAAEWIEASE